jgi:hypothetical protein
VNNPKKYRDRYITSIPFEKEYWIKLNQLLPRGVNVSDEINTFIKERVKELEDEKNRDASIALEASPIRPNYYNDYNINSATLDKYISINEDRTKRVKTLWNKDSIQLYELYQQLDSIQDEINTIRYRRYKHRIPQRQLNMKLIPFIEQSVYGDK